MQRRRGLYRFFVWAQAGGSGACAVSLILPDIDTLGWFRHKDLVSESAPTEKPLRVVEDHDGDTYRAVYTVKFEGAVYALHAFQKKSRKGIATSAHDLGVVASRLKLAEADYLKRRKA